MRLEPWQICAENSDMLLLPQDFCKRYADRSHLCQSVKVLNVVNSIQNMLEHIEGQIKYVKLVLPYSSLRNEQYL